ncbi:bifunctional 3-(3-hydroxy-phenyl)propionate/3-hydroxycinnamic acid hydroxylase [Streptomyces chartreusis]|uniref:bifunctional 3-(3-hydroxy-phenyl)propionate/3-hydroxycinnamic acid hydroxylase n=1 Tax=Streptomyces chartreusis TaxID=1969 RepID=UPI002F915070|nr:bifunctional 3-(3-hydroxy-phenyl)propionate/3-hydroxycinnamic acid hydroxylase [Streptomyces chartreusis]WTA33430.1 bifunctional 3-(3-hydroxy-phenyl)propionate/3-hydroxycinnamic acid hydroxylase [Streptomyces chartreusis]
MHANEADMVDVTIVGYGPVGQLLAAMLGQRGYHVAVFERWPKLYGRARAGHLDHEAMRVIQTIGVADELEANAYRPPAYEFRNGRHELLMSFDWHRDEISGWASDYFTYQPDIEDAFTARVHALPNVDVNLGYEVQQLTQFDDYVEIAAARFEPETDHRGVKSSNRQQVRSRYVVGADGANSSVREKLDGGILDLGFEEKWAVYDITPFAPLGLEYNDAQICDPQQPRCLFRIGDKRQRFEFMLLPGDDEAHLSTADGAWEMMGRFFGLARDQANLERTAVFQFRSQVARQWRAGRVLLAGDAAHVMPPFLGQGLISGIRDAVSLEWRLDLALRGLASERLLDTYQIEREPHVTEIIRQSIAAGKIACTTDPEAARQRDEAFWSGQVPAPPPFPALREGALADPPDRLTGTLAPQGHIERNGQHGRFDDVYGPGWTLLTRTPAPAHFVGPETAFFEAIGGRVVAITESEDIDGVYREFFESNELAAIIYRPDFRIFGTAVENTEIPSLISRLHDRLATVGDIDDRHNGQAPAA